AIIHIHLVVIAGPQTGILPEWNKHSLASVTSMATVTFNCFNNTSALTRAPHVADSRSRTAFVCPDSRGVSGGPASLAGGQCHRQPEQLRGMDGPARPPVSGHGPDQLGRTPPARLHRGLGDRHGSGF